MFSGDVTQEELHGWGGTLAEVIDTLEPEIKERAVLVLATDADGGDQMISAGIEDKGVEHVDHATSEFLAVVHPTERRVLAMATKALWSPDVNGEPAPSWTLCVVARNLPALWAARQDGSPDGWWSLQDHAVPYFLLSTASGLREALLTGKELQVKNAFDGDRRLFGTIFDDPPPLDEDGLL